MVHSLFVLMIILMIVILLSLLSILTIIMREEGVTTPRALSMFLTGYNCKKLILSCIDLHYMLLIYFFMPCQYIGKTLDFNITLEAVGRALLRRIGPMRVQLKRMEMHGLASLARLFHFNCTNL